MIDKLTPEQEKKVSEYLNKWLEIGRSTKPIDKKATTDSIKWLYEFGNYNKTPYMWFCDSPMQMQLIINILENENLIEKPIRSNLESNLWSNQLSFNYFFAPNLETYWVGFYDYILHELFPEQVKKFEIFSNQGREFYKNTYLIIPYENICFISERPTEQHIDLDTGNLHNPNGPAMKFKDGYEFYALHNIRIEKEMLNYNAKEIMAVENVEQRLVLIKNFGVENMLKELDSKIIDTFKEYVLHSVLIEGNKEKLLQMQNPSEPKVHYEFVPPEIETCQQAMAWRFGLDLYVNPVMKA